jgi:hypothetical protein
MSVFHALLFHFGKILLLFNLQYLKGMKIQTFRKHKTSIFSVGVNGNITGNDYIWSSS